MLVLAKKNAIICYLDASSNTANVGLSIEGQVRLLGSPFRARVRVFNKDTGELVRDVIADMNGCYKTNHLKKGKYFIVSHHPANQFNAVIQDNVVPK